MHKGVSSFMLWSVCVCVFVVVVEDRGWVGALGAAESLPGEKSVIEVIKHFRC